MTRACRLVFALLCLALLAGCGAGKSIARGTPEATAEAFVAAIRAGDFDVAAAGFDYDQWAQRENPDWGSFAPQARKEIIGKLQEEKAGELKSLAGMMAGELSVGEAAIEGERASVPVTVGGSTLNLQMIRKDGLWYVLRLQGVSVTASP